VLLLGERGFNTKGACQAGEVPLLVINELKPTNITPNNNNNNNKTNQIQPLKSPK